MALGRSRRNAAPGLTRVLSVAAARAALPIAMPLYGGLAVVSGILFAPRAMHAAEVTRGAHASPALGLGLFAAWTLSTVPIARAVLEQPSTFMLRALPVPGWRFWAVGGAHLALVELPWVALWTRGDGVIAGAAACASAVAAHALMLARPLRALEIVLALLLVGTFLAGAPVAFLLPLGVAGAPFALAAAWRRAPERDARPHRAPLGGPAPLALAVAHLVGLRRGDPSALLRVAIPVVIGGFVTPLAARGYDLDTAEAVSVLSLGIATGSLAIAAAWIASAVIRAERRDRWLYDAIGTGGGARVTAASAATALSGAALGALHGAIAAWQLAAAAPLALRLVVLGTAHGAVLGVLAAGYARHAQRGSRKDADRALLGYAVVVVAAVVSLQALGEATLAPLALVALVHAALSSRSATTLPEPLRARVAPGRRQRASCS